MRIVVLMKPVPDTTGQERLGPEFRVDRTAAPAVVNANDEYAVEAALKLVEAGGGEVTLLTMAPPTGPETMRKALAMGAHRGVLVTDPALAGSDTLSTVKVLAAALRGLEFDLVLAGADTSDGGRRRRAGRGRGPAAAAVSVLCRPDRADRGPGSCPPPQRGRLRRPRCAPAGGRRGHAGPGRAALPLAQGDHGRPVSRDRDEVAVRPGTVRR